MFVLNSSIAQSSGTPEIIFNRADKTAKITARYICNNCNHTTSVTKTINTLNWQQLEYRRTQSSVLSYTKSEITHNHLTRTYTLNWQQLEYGRTHSSVLSYTKSEITHNYLTCTCTRNMNYLIP